MSVLASEIDAPPTTETMLDQRIVRLSFEVNGKIKVYEDLFIVAVGVKYANPLQNEAQITIYNLDHDTRDYLLTELSPYNANYTGKSITLEAGRVSYGTTVIFSGNIIYASVTQPPDIGITFKCLTGNFLKGRTFTRQYGAFTPMSIIAAGIAADNDLDLQFQAADKEIGNFSYSGSALKQIELLAAMGQVNAYVDDGTLVVKSAGEMLRGKLTQMSASTGMIGIPEFTERGCRVKFLVDNKTTLGGGIQLTSELYPTINGLYIIYQLAFIITNRLVPFYYIADCQFTIPTSEEATNG